jgi:hypothetical protein
MAEWLEDHVPVIGPLNSNFGLIIGLWLNWRLSGDHRWKVETTGWEDRGVVCGKPTPSRL